jgi:uncharacterized protein YkwD
LAAVVARQENELVADINRDRAAQGENALAIDPVLVKLARDHSKDMCVRDYFDHTAPPPLPALPIDRYQAAVPKAPANVSVAENIYYRSGADSPSDYAADADEAFMKSPEHRGNILTRDFIRVGAGIYVNSDTGEFWVTVMFLRD